MTLEQFKDHIKRIWETTECSLINETDIYTESDTVWNDTPEMDNVTSTYKREFNQFNYTEAVDKEVEAIWLKRNSKLGKALR